ncbi:nose resistant to fluoxetine protein 6-like [Anopheles darlingi]|uniref:nose resistant to fluoxetine protein 6-like n=1 Tax=Anopheles darlingi TaxID=43151 RepID=UPI0020FFF889|nr:nose resistant to fluoxetine protein 6-like [Anopheles darlingi]
MNRGLCLVWSVDKWRLWFCLWLVSQAQAEGPYRSPEIFMYDDLESCTARSDTSVYCYAKTVLHVDQFPAGYVVPNTETTDRIVFNHRRHVLELGVCTAKCLDEVHQMSEMERNALDLPDIPVNFTFLIPSKVFPTMVADNRRYSSLVNVCINKRLRDEYGIMGHTILEYCRPPSSQPAPPFSFLELAFIAITVAFVGALLIATLVDFYSTNDNAPHDDWVMAFSVRQNWNRLLADPRSPSLHHELLYIDGLRVLVNHLVIVLHSSLAASVVPASNYEGIERLLFHYPFLAYFSANAFLVQIFFTIGGYLLSINFLQDSRTHPIDARYAIKKLLNRLLRLMPVYGYFLLFSVSVNVRFDTNVNGFRLFTAENGICRQNWWSNLLFINNLAWPEDLCLMHTWYLATDLQLFVLALALLLAVHRWPKSSGIVFTMAILVSLWMPAYITHTDKLHPVLPAKLGEAKLLTMHEPWIRKIYMPSYANTGSYLAGLIAGYLHDRVINHKLQLSAFPLYRAVDRMITPLLIAILLSCGMWYYIEVPKPSLWVSLYSILYRNVIGVFMATWFLRSINTPKGWFRRILSMKLFTTLGKLTYSVYVLHDVVMRFMLLIEPMGAAVTLGKFVRSIYQVNISAFVGGFFVFLLIEQPMIQLLRPIIDRVCSWSNQKKKN